jgi:hypothetical protein
MKSLLGFVGGPHFHATGHGIQIPTWLFYTLAGVIVAAIIAFKIASSGIARRR